MFVAALKLLMMNIVALSLMFIVRTFLSDYINVSLQVWELFYSVYGVIYAIVIGFILAELLTRFHRLMTCISNELNAVEDIRDFLVYVDKNEKTKLEINKALLRYVTVVVDCEWELMKTCHSSFDSDTSAELYQLMEAVENIKKYDDSDGVALAAIIGKISDVTTFRTERFERSRQRLSLPLHILIVFMSFILVSGFVMMNIPSLWVHTFVIFSVVTSVYLLYLVIDDLNHPYEGVWNITDRPFRDVLVRLQRNMQRESLSNAA